MNPSFFLTFVGAEQVFTSGKCIFVQPILQENTKCIPSLLWFYRYIWILSRNTYLLPCGTNNLQKENKDLDNVDVEGKSRKDIFIFGDGVLPVPYQKLCVVGQELHRNIWINNNHYRNSCRGLIEHSPKWRRWFPKLHKAYEATEPATKQNSENIMLSGLKLLLHQEP